MFVVQDPRAQRRPHESRQAISHRVRIPAPEGGEHVPDGFRRCVSGDQVEVDAVYLLVRDPDQVAVSGRGQIPGHGQHGVGGVASLFYLGVDDPVVHRCLDLLAGAEGHQSAHGGLVGVLNHRLHHGVPAGPRPVRSWNEPAVYVAEHAPGIVHLGVPEAVSVVPFLAFVEFLGTPVEFQHGFHLVFGESEAFFERPAEHVVRPEVVQAGEQAFFGYPHDAGDDSEPERFVGFQG